MLRTALAVALVGLTAPAFLAAADSPPSRLMRAALHADRPGIRLWTTQDEVYRRHDRARVYFRTERDAFVTVFRVDTDGRVRILFPRDPWDDNFVRGGATYRVSNYRRGEAFLVDDDPGMGYVFAIAAGDPFDFGAIAGRDSWEVHRVGDRVHGDPFESLMDIVDHLLPADYADYDTHLLPYYVERRYDYPRFVCYDCHSYIGFSSWNPYLHSCSRFSLWVYNDPFYYYPSYWYPTRYYGGTRVVYSRPRGTTYVGRYVFKNRSQPTDPPIVYRRRTDVASGAGVRPEDRGVRGRDIGGTGSVPVPGTGRRVVDRASPSGNPPVIGGGTRPEPRGNDQPGQPRNNDPRGRDQPGDRPGNQPDRPGNQPGDQPGADDPRRRGDPRNDEPAGRPRDDRNEPPGRRGGDPRNDEPGGEPRGAVAKSPRDVELAEPVRTQRPTIDRSIGERERRGVYREPAAAGQAQPRQGGSGAARPQAEPRREQPRYETPRSEPRSQPQPERRAEPPRSEPRAAPQPERRAEPPRSEPRAEPPRSQPQPERRAEPQRSEPRNEPAPRLERRRPDE